MAQVCPRCGVDTGRPVHPALPCRHCGLFSPWALQPGYRRKKKRKALSAIARRRVYERYDGRCFRCEQPTGYRTGEVHHLVPRSQGGGNDRANLAWICPSCHHAVHGRKPKHS